MPERGQMKPPREVMSALHVRNMRRCSTTSFFALAITPPPAETCTR